LRNPDGTLTPAYGRDYKSLSAMQADFDAGKDFTINSPCGSTYCSIRDFHGKGSVQARYNRLTKTGFLTFNRE
jgi:hypothetical protein